MMRDIHFSVYSLFVQYGQRGKTTMVILILNSPIIRYSLYQGGNVYLLIQ